MIRPITIACRVPNPFDATSWYRAYGPLGHLRATDDFNLLPMDAASLITCAMADIAFFQRPTSQEEVHAMALFKKMNVPVVVDYDDDLLGIPKDNPFYQSYTKPEIIEAIKFFIAQSDAVIVSTQALKNSMVHLTDPNKIHVVRNALDERLFKFNIKKERNYNAPVLWRGGMSHERDLREFQEVILSKKDIHFQYFGWNPWFLTHDKKHNLLEAEENILKYFEKLLVLNPKKGMVPLFDSQFNRCKSNIGLLEMSWAGAACLVPDWDEWKMPGVIAYHSKESFSQGLDDLSRLSPIQIEEYNAQTNQFIEANYMLKQINPLRAKVFRDVLKRGL